MESEWVNIPPGNSHGHTAGHFANVVRKHAAQQLSRHSRLFLVAALLGAISGEFIAIFIHGRSWQPNGMISTHPSGRNNAVRIPEAARSDPLTTQPESLPIANTTAQYKDPTVTGDVEAKHLESIFSEPILHLSDKEVEATANTTAQCKDPTSVVAAEVTTSVPQLDVVPTSEPVLQGSNEEGQAAAVLEDNTGLAEPTTTAAVPDATSSSTESPTTAVQPSVIHPAQGCGVNTTVNDEHQENKLPSRMDNPTESLLIVLLKNSDNQQEQLDRVLNKLQEQQAELSSMDGRIINLQEALCKDLGGCTNVEPMVTAVKQRYGTHANCNPRCADGLVTTYFCDTGCSIYKLGSRLAAMTPKVKKSGTNLLEGHNLRDYFCQQQDALLKGIAAKIGYVEDAAAAKCYSYGCHSLWFRRRIWSPDQDCAIIRLNAFLERIGSDDIKPCKKNGWFFGALRAAVHNCAMEKLDVLMDAVFD